MLGLGEREQQRPAVEVEVERNEAAVVFQRAARKPARRDALAGEQAAHHRLRAERLLQHIDAAGLRGVEAEVLVNHVPRAADLLVVLQEYDPVEIQQRILERDLPADGGEPGEMFALLHEGFFRVRAQRL